MKKGTLATALIGFGISQIVLGVIASKKREKEFKSAMDAAAQNATDILKRQLQSGNPYYNAGAFGVKTAMEMEKGKESSE